MRKMDRNLILAVVFTAASVAWLLAAEQGSRPAEIEEQTGIAAVPGIRQPTTQPVTHPATGSMSDACRLLLVAGSDEDLLAMAAPVAAKLSKGQGKVLLAVMSDETRDEAGRLIALVGKTKTLLLQRAPRPMTGENPVVQLQRALTLPDGALAAGLAIAKHFWGRSVDVVLAVEGDGEAGLLASALAAHRRVPFLLVPQAETGDSLTVSLQQLGAKRVSVVVREQAAPPVWARHLTQKMKLLSCGDARAALVETLGLRSVRNVIVVRAPDGPAATARASWLAPYLSYARNSVIVAASSTDAGTVETEVAAVVSACKLTPRTVTLLADYKDIGVRSPGAGFQLGQYAVEIEPCSGPGRGGAGAYGVGRIPFPDAARASLLIARGLVREQPAAEPAGGVLMVANPNSEYGALPLAETVARLNVEEFRNFRVPIEAYFGVPAGNPEIRKAAGTAGLIVYQGHITDEAIFRGPAWPQPLPGKGTDIFAALRPKPPLFTRTRCWIEDQAMMLGEEVLFTGYYVGYELPAIARGWLAEQEGQNQGKQVDGSVPDALAVDAEPEPGDLPPGRQRHDGDGAGAALTKGPVAPIELSGSALVFLQSCSSLTNEATTAAVRAGACGVIGSTTSIHSASGSSFVKAWSDAVLYRGATAGEAMRDARNYFLLLAKLKGARGHKELAKVLRVGLSFRLWGDPEALVLPEIKGKPVRRPITGRLRGRQVTVQLPRRRLPQVKTAKYAVRAFPGSQTAGIVKRLKGKDYRRLMPVYFLRLDRPAGVDTGTWRALIRREDKDTRAVFSTDPLGQYVYVLYFPDEEKNNERITLVFQP